MRIEKKWSIFTPVRTPSKLMCWCVMNIVVKPGNKTIFEEKASITFFLCTFSKVYLYTTVEHFELLVTLFLNLIIIIYVINL